MEQKNQKRNKRVLKTLVLLVTLFTFFGIGAGAVMAETLTIENKTFDNALPGSGSYTRVIAVANEPWGVKPINDLTGKDSLVINNVIFKDNTNTETTTNGVILNTEDTLSGFTTTIKGNTSFTGNTGYTSGMIKNYSNRTLTFDKDSDVTFAQNKITINDPLSGRGGAIHNYGEITFNGTANFTGNVSTGEGGAIANGGKITFNGKTSFRNNTANGAKNDIENAGLNGELNFEKDSITTFDGGISRSLNASVKSGTINFKEGATITMNDLNWQGTERDFKNLKISYQNFNADGGTFVINTDLAKGTGDTITLQDCTITDAHDDVYVQVAYDPTAVTGKSVTGEHTFLTVTNGNLINVTAQAYDYSFNGKKLTITPTVQNAEGSTAASSTWKITALTVVNLGVDETTKAVADSASMMSFAWINTINNLQKRMGDLRGGAASNMAWARFQRNNDDVNVGRGQSLSGNLYQLGYDFLIKSNDVAKNFFGLSVDVFDGSQSFNIGGGDAKSTTLSAYYTKIYESGHYFDFIFRYGRFESDTTSYDASVINPQLTKLDYAMNGVTLSGEYGYRWGLSKSGLYLEPQAEFIYGYLSGAKATSSTGLLADIDSTNHFVGRLGLAFGQKVKNFNYYLRGSYYHDFAGTTNVKYGDANYKQDGAENWWEVSLGGGWNISKVSYFYAELTKHFKDISNSLNFNLGFRLTL